MNTSLTTTELQRALQLLENEAKITYTLQQLQSGRVKQSYKDTLPFSQRLNDFITQWFTNHWDMFVLTDEDDFDVNDLQGTLDKHREQFLRTGKIHIWTGASDKTIFASAKVNHYFRAWHDYIHVTENLGYDFIGESAVCKIQQAQLPLDWGFERALVDSEIVGQALYYMKYNEFIDDQRAFTLQFLTNGKINDKFVI